MVLILSLFNVFPFRVRKLFIAFCVDCVPKLYTQICDKFYFLTIKYAIIVLLNNSYFVIKLMVFIEHVINF